jgi:mRNA interferase MazF
MARGDLYVVSAPGEYGKPRPCVVVQSGFFEAEGDSRTVCLITREIREAPIIRVLVEPTARNGLRHRSQIMVDKIQSIHHKRFGGRIGRLEDAAMLQVDRALALFLGLAEA